MEVVHKLCIQIIDSVKLIFECLCICSRKELTILRMYPEAYKERPGEKFVLDLLMYNRSGVKQTSPLCYYLLLTFLNH